MSKRILVFQIPEEAAEHQLAECGPKYYNVLWDFDQWLRQIIKYEDRETIDPQEVRDKLYEFLRDNDVSFNV